MKTITSQDFKLLTNDELKRILFTTNLSFNDVYVVKKILGLRGKYNPDNGFIKEKQTYLSTL
jgi:hypothetical protein